MFTLFVYLLVTFCSVHSICNNPPIDLNTATQSELDSLPYISSSTAQLIINIRPICSPLELTMSPKKISGITENRLNNNWDWYSDQLCTDTCCKADASCVAPTPTPQSSAIYSWQTSSWSDCSANCNTGTQYRNITCFNSTHTVNNALCLIISVQPINKQFCNVEQCPIYEWSASEWNVCNSVNNECIQTRTVICYETVQNTIQLDDICSNTIEKPNESQSCDTCTKISNLNKETTEIDNNISVDVDLLHQYNQEQCHTNSYRNINIDPFNKTLITRRSCAIDIWVFVHGKTDNTLIDISWFYLNVTLKANIDENIGNVWNNNYLSWYTNNASSGWITITFPNHAPIGEFVCELYYKHNSIVTNIKQISNFTLYVLFNPYSSLDDVYMSSITNRKEYIENEIGLIWQGLSDNNNGFKWIYDQFNFKNLQISMNLLNRLTLQYRNDIVLISRHISYAVGEDICYGKWGEGSYTTGRPSGGYYCSKSKNNCRDPSSWTGTTPIFDLYRDVLNSVHQVQYCQCFVYAGIVTTVGRSLGIPTRPISNFQSAHDTDFNRGIEKYWIFDENSKVYEPTDSGESSDSIWSFHVWNEMSFKRNDFILDSITYNTRGWQAIDATPQEYSFGGNPILINNIGAYQMGPASLALIKQNKNPFECLYAAVDKKRFGCFDNEFVISEVNANYNFWYKQSTNIDTKFKLLDSFLTDPWGDNYGTIGQQISTKKPGNIISDDCLNDIIGDCSNELLDITLLYKNTEPSNPSVPTNSSNYYDTPGQERNRRRRTLSWTDNSYNESLDFEGIEYTINETPALYDLNTMIVADNNNEISYLYGNDYTFGMMEIQIDSYFDDVLNVYCSFIVTAHDYSGHKLYLNNSNLTNVKTEKMSFILDAGESNKCLFYINYDEYEQWTSVDVFSDISEIPYFFKFTLSVSIYDNDTSIDAYKSIIEQRDILICVPIYRLRDRIICQSGLKWFEPSYDLVYDCYGNNIDMKSVGDGFCDDMNNISPCFDGGDCCKSSCIASDTYFCEYFNCIDDRVNQQNINYFQCNEPLSFIDYMDNLLNYSICVDVEQSIVEENFICSDKIWTSNTGNLCVDYVSGVNGIFGEIKSCFNETFNSIEIEMQEIIHVVIDCMDIQQSLDNDTYTPLWNTTTTETVTTSMYAVSTTESVTTDDIADIANLNANIWYIASMFLIYLYI